MHRYDGSTEARNRRDYDSRSVSFLWAPFNLTIFVVFTAQLRRDAAKSRSERAKAIERLMVLHGRLNCRKLDVMARPPDCVTPGPAGS